MSFSFGFSFGDGDVAENQCTCTPANPTKRKCPDYTITSSVIIRDEDLPTEMGPPTGDELSLVLSKEFNTVSTSLGPIYRTNISSTSFKIDTPAPDKPSTGGSEDDLLSNTSTDVSDLIPGHYEGGLKTWECSIDLCRYLIQDKDSIAGTSVLELGCGSGLPGIFAMKYLSARCAYLIDFNTTVISDVTWPNVCRNLYSGLDQTPLEERRKLAVKCFAGDWAHLQELLSRAGGGGREEYLQQFGVIFSAETLYTSESCKQIADLLKLLEYPHGIAYIASKRYYFGVGGGTAEFIELLSQITLSEREDIRRKRVFSAGGASVLSGDLVWNVETVAVLEDKSSNIREILKVTYRR